MAKELNPAEILEKKQGSFYKTRFNDGLSVKDVDMNKRTVQVIYSTMNFFDSDADVLAPGSFQKSIKERGPKSQAKAKIKHALFHDLTRLPGRIEVLEEMEVDGRTVEYAEVKMSDTVEGNDTLIKYQEKIYDNHSIGFQYVAGKIKLVERGDEEYEKVLATLINPEEAEENGFLFLVNEVKQFEGSTVAFGANADTPFLGVKSENIEGISLKLNEKLDRMESLMRNGGMSDAGFDTLAIEIAQIKEAIKSYVEPKQPNPKEQILASEGNTQQEKHKESELIMNLKNII